MILAFTFAVNPNYVHQVWHSYLFSVAMTTVCAAMAFPPTNYIVGINAATSILSITFHFISWIFILGENNRISRGLTNFNSAPFAWSQKI